MQMRARGVAGRADRAERIAAQNALPGGDRYFAAMGVKRLIAVRVAGVSCVERKFIAP